MDRRTQNRIAGRPGVVSSAKPGMYCRCVRWQVWLGFLAACGEVMPLNIQRDAASDAVVPGEPSRTPEFVQNFFSDCGGQQDCTLQAPGRGSGQILLVTATYGTPVIHVESITDDTKQMFRRFIDPVAWAPGHGGLRTEVWWGKRTVDTTEIKVSLTGPAASGLAVYINEFDATAIDQIATASGDANKAMSFSSGARTIAVAPQVVFGHGESTDSIVAPGTGFMMRRKELGNIEQTKLADRPGSYEAFFDLDQGGPWVALMVTLR